MYTETTHCEGKPHISSFQHDSTTIALPPLRLLG